MDRIKILKQINETTSNADEIVVKMVSLIPQGIMFMPLDVILCVDCDNEDDNCTIEYLYYQMATKLYGKNQIVADFFANEWDKETVKLLKTNY